VFLKACRQPYGGLFSANRESELRTAMSEWGEWSPECAPKTNLIRLEYRFLKCLFRAENQDKSNAIAPCKCLKTRPPPIAQHPKGRART
jgi:hypothetical protein